MLAKCPALYMHRRHKKETRGKRREIERGGGESAKTDCSVSARTPQPITGGKQSKAGARFLQLLACSPAIKDSYGPHPPVISDGLCVYTLKYVS